MAPSVKSSVRKLTGKRKRPDGDDGPSQAVKKAAVGSAVQSLPHFDDLVPSRYPAKYGSRPTKWPGPKEWVQLLDVPPHRIWGKDCCVLYQEPWLHGMGVPKKPRSHLFLTPNDLERNHHAVYYHAALRAALEPAIVKNALYDSARKRTEDAETRARRIARKYPDLSERYLASCRERVMKMGFCVVEDVFNDTAIPEGPVKTVYDEQPASKVVDYYTKQFPKEDGIRRNAKNSFWEPTFNCFEDMQSTGQGRFVTSKAGLYTYTEYEESTVGIAKCRAAPEVRALQICVAMGLEETGEGMLAIPRTGCRLFASTAMVERQLPHTDFDAYAIARDGFSPNNSVGYSVMWTADDASPILLWEYSHVLQSGTMAASKKVAQTVRAQRVVIPPFSCIIIRGDLVYAGPGWRDYTLAEKEALKYPVPVQFHMYICRWGMQRTEREKRLTHNPVVPKTVHFSEKFQPSVQPNPSWIINAPQTRNSDS